VFLVFPLNLPEPQLRAKKEALLRGFSQVLTNKSAVACLVTAFFGNAFVYGAMVFEVTFLRQVFSASPGFAALVGPLIGTAVITVGVITGGHIVNHVGRKRLTVVAIFFSGLFLLFSYFIPDLWIRQAIRWTASIFIGITIASASNLTLEQVPQFRGTTMSLASAFSGVGTAFGIAIAGAILNLYTDPRIGFQALGLTVCALAFVAALINLLFAKDPFKTQYLKPKSL
jgi:predicted MFS family arabinose efflux permease